MAFAHLVEMQFVFSDLWKYMHNNFLFNFQRVFIKRAKREVELL